MKRGTAKSCAPSAGWKAPASRSHRNTQHSTSQMTEDQKAMSMILELLHAAKGVPVAGQRLEADLKYCGFRRLDLPALLERLRERKLIASAKDGLGIRRYTITPAGKEALDAS